ncbi:MAG TPA: hypothetical protein V6D11_31675 [Waterburya sp.]
MESPFVTVLFFAGIALMVVVSGGVLYLTAAEWRDRRRRDRDKKL